MRATIRSALAAIPCLPALVFVSLLGYPAAPAAASTDLDRIFAAVATGIHYEPYRGIQRGVDGTLEAGSGNAVDQALLLANLLGEAGYQTRLARGSLQGENVATLLRGMYPPWLPELSVATEYEPFDPAQDPELRAIAQDHVWVEVFQGDDWLPLDPSFPRATPGEAYAVADARFERPPRELFQHVRITVREATKENANRELGVIEGTVAELGARPVALVMRSIPQVATGEVPRRAGPAGLFGGLGGALGGGRAAPAETESPGEPEMVGVRIRRHVVGDDGRREIGATLVLAEERNDLIEREWIEITLTAPGARPQTIERTLFPGDLAASGGGPPENRTFVINVLPGPLTTEQVHTEATARAGTLDLPAIADTLERLAGAAGDAADVAALEIAKLGEAVGLAAGEFVALRFAAESDVLARELARTNGLVPVWAQPRILITSFETAERADGELHSTVSLDLRVNVLEAYPYPGVPAVTAGLFRLARGIQDTVLEGEMVARATGYEAPVNVFPLMARAHADDVPVLVLTAANAGSLRSLRGLPPRYGAQIQRALADGRHVIIPERAVALAGADRWGWWELAPNTGAVVGVMESGQNQGMVEYKLSLERVGLDDRSGFVIGAMIGGTATLWTVAGLILEYGGTTPEMMDAVKKQLEAVLCSSCFTGAEAKGVDQLTVRVDVGCLEWKKDLSGSADGVSGSVNFCEEYAKGFQCASGMLLAAMQGQAGIDAGVTVSDTQGVSVSFGCQKLASPHTVSTRVPVLDGVWIKP
jgi:hypothetical protein